MTRLNLCLSLTLGLMTLGTVSSAAQAAPTKARFDVTVIHATEGEAEVDPALETLSETLKSRSKITNGLRSSSRGPSLHKVCPRRWCSPMERQPPSSSTDSTEVIKVQLSSTVSRRNFGSVMAVSFSKLVGSLRVGS